jgi:hypothetical protein
MDRIIAGSQSSVMWPFINGQTVTLLPLCHDRPPAGLSHDASDGQPFDYRQCVNVRLCAYKGYKHGCPRSIRSLEDLGILSLDHGPEIAAQINRMAAIHPCSKLQLYYPTSNKSSIYHSDYINTVIAALKPHVVKSFADLRQSKLA